MSSRPHNKKRNSLLMYEFIVRTIAKSLMVDDNQVQNNALKILKKNYRQGSELYREFKIANALYRTTVSLPATAASIMSEAKSAIRSIDESKLHKEKSNLIRDFNYNIGDDAYNTPITNYKMFATIQTLFNEWKKTNPDIEVLAEYEDKVINWLVEQNKSFDVSLPDHDAGTTRIVYQLMEKKLNDKYDSVLTGEQKKLVREFALSGPEGNKKLFESLTLIKENLQASIRRSSDDKHKEIMDMLNEEKLDKVDDDMVVRFMLYSKMLSEFGGSK